MGATDALGQFLDNQILLADEELVLNIDEPLRGLNHMQVSYVNTLLFLHEALAPGGRAAQELLLVSALLGVVTFVGNEKTFALFSGLGDELYEFFGHAL